MARQHNEGADRKTFQSKAVSPKPAEGGRQKDDTTRGGSASLRSAKGAAMLAQAVEWVDANPDAWAFMERRALDEAEAGRCVRFRALLEEVRGIDFTDRWGTPTRTDNTICAALARLMVERHPAILPMVRLRKSMVDEAGQ